MLIDITQPIHPGMVVWPGDPGVILEVEQDLACGDVSFNTRLHMGMHTGTHLDAPCHFEPGAAAVDELDLDLFVGPCRVVHLPHCDQIRRADLERVDLAGVTRVLFRTSNGARFESGAFQEDYVAVAPDAAQHLADLGVRVVGVDYLSVEPFRNDAWATHHALLRRGVIPIEGLDLRGVEAGDYELIALPLRIRGGDGAPIRAVLRR